MSVEVFTRRASGLVRSVKGRDVFIYNVATINIGIGVGTALLYGPALYQGASLNLATWLVVIGSLFQVLVYYFFSVTMPRSGGEYIYLTRTFVPAVGFALSLQLAVWHQFYGAWLSSTFANMGLSTFFHILGTNIGSSGLLGAAVWVSTPVGIFLIGASLILFAAYLHHLGLEQFFKVQMWAFAISMIGLVALIAVLMSHTRADFVMAFNSYAAGQIAGPSPYDTVISVAKAGGWGNPGFNWPATLKFTVWPFFMLAFGIMCGSFAGEIRNVQKTQLFGLPGAVIFTGLIMVILNSLTTKVMGYDFLGAIGWNSLNAPQASTAVTPWIHLLVSVLTKNTLLLVVITVGFLMWSYFWVGGNMLYGTRAVLAWSMDRVLPEKLSFVDPKRHTPTYSIIVCASVQLILLALYCFTPWLKSLVGIFAMCLTFAALSVAGIVFPYVRKDMFERSPVNHRIGKVPILSIVSVLNLIFMLFIIYMFLIDGFASGGPKATLIAVTPAGAGLIYFFIQRAVKARRGINVDLAFKQIPVE